MDIFENSVKERPDSSTDLAKLTESLRKKEKDMKLWCLMEHKHESQLLYEKKKKHPDRFVKDVISASASSWSPPFVGGLQILAC